MFLYKSSQIENFPFDLIKGGKVRIDGFWQTVIEIGPTLWMVTPFKTYMEYITYEPIREVLKYSDGSIAVKIRHEPVHRTELKNLFTWEEAVKACPTGWRLPTKKDFLRAADFYGSRVALDYLLPHNELEMVSLWGADPRFSLVVINDTSGEGLCSCSRANYSTNNQLNVYYCKDIR